MKAIFKFASLLSAAVMLFASCEGTAPVGPDVPGNENNNNSNNNNDLTKGELVLSVDKQIIQAGVDQAVLTVKFNDQELKDSVMFFDGNNKPIELGPDFIFSTETIGEYSFWANYKTFNSNKVTVTVVDTKVPDTPADPQPENTSFVRRVLLTKITGAGCVACPNVTAALHYFYYGNKDAKPNPTKPHELADLVLKAEAHTFESGYDPAQLSGFYSVSSWPTVIVDWAEYFVPSQSVSTLSAIEEMVEGRYEAEKAKVGIAVNSICENNSVTLKVCVKAAVDGQYRVGAWLLEDNIQGQQAGVSGGSENAWYHEFDDCIRIADSKLSAGDFAGHKLGFIESGKSAEKMFTWKLKDSWVKENLELCIFVSAADETGRYYRVNNVIKAPVSGVTAYEYAAK